MALAEADTAPPLEGGTSRLTVQIHATIELGHRLGLKVVAEGVEDKLTAEWLAQLQCDIGQGNFFSAPLPSAEFLKWMDEWAGNQNGEHTAKRNKPSEGGTVVSLTA